MSVELRIHTIIYNVFLARQKNTFAVELQLLCHLSVASLYQTRLCRDVMCDVYRYQPWHMLRDVASTVPQQTPSMIQRY